MRKKENPEVLQSKVCSTCLFWDDFYHRSLNKGLGWCSKSKSSTHCGSTCKLWESKQDKEDADKKVLRELFGEDFI